MSMPVTTTSMGACLTLLTALATHAVEPVLAQRGKLLLEDDFNATVLSDEKWSIQKSETGIELRNGHLLYDCSKSQDAANRLGLGHAFEPAIADFVLELQITPRPGFNGMNIVLNDDLGHCLVVTIKPGMMYGYKFAEHGKRSFAEYVDCTGLALEEGRTYRVTLEKAGSQMFLYIDDQHFLMGQHPRFKNPLHRVALTFLGGQGALDEFKLWEGIPQADPERSGWETLKASRPAANLDHDPDFKKRKLMADARQELKTDEAFRKLSMATDAVYQDLQQRYPFFRSPKAADKRKHQAAGKADATYAGLLRKLADHERLEMDYLYSRFPSIRPGRSKSSSN